MSDQAPEAVEPVATGIDPATLDPSTQGAVVATCPLCDQQHTVTSEEEATVLMDMWEEKLDQLLADEEAAAGGGDTGGQRTSEG